MSGKKEFKCVNCGAAASALYRNYGPTVLKLTKCESCKGIVDKYIEYDPVIVMIDLVLVSKEAQRHIIYNTEFKSYWKLLIVLTLLETYGAWRSDSLFSVALSALCSSQPTTDNSTQIVLPLNVSIPEGWMDGWIDWSSECAGLDHADKDGTDLFIWEKDFYVLFLSTLAGTVAFITTVHILMSFCTSAKVGARAAAAACSLAHVALLASAPALVWGAGAARLSHRALVQAYCCAVFYSVYRVLYGGRALPTALALLAGGAAKGATALLAAPALRRALHW